MRPLFYIIAVMLILGWLLGAFVYDGGSIINMLLVMAVISLIFGFITKGSIN